jgi:hypothetical protein
MKKTPKKGDPAQRAWEVVQEATAASEVPLGIAAARINQVLEDKGYSSGDVTGWWNTPNSDLGGRTPHQVWFSELAVSPETIVRVHLAASSTAPVKST